MVLLLDVKMILLELLMDLRSICSIFYKYEIIFKIPKIYFKIKKQMLNFLKVSV